MNEDAGFRGTRIITGPSAVTCSFETLRLNDQFGLIPLPLASRIEPGQVQFRGASAFVAQRSLDLGCGVD